MGIELTERAAREFKRIVSEQAAGSHTCLRVAVKAGGCSGFTYVLDLAAGAEKGDKTFESQGVTVVCDPRSFLYLAGTTIDFQDNLLSRGFVFDNPNAKSTCDCGISFAI